MRLRVIDAGRMSYDDALALQLSVFNEVAEGAPDTLIFVEHDPVLTLGANFHDANLLLSLEEYENQGIEVRRTERGGDVTYHGPGQLVIYPIFDLSRRVKDLHKWLRELEEAVIVSLREYGLEGDRFAPHTGVWLGAKKVAAIGIKVRRWVSIHGIAVNCDNDLGPFETIVPCGIQGYGVTSISEAGGRTVGVGEYKWAIVRAFETVFGLTVEAEGPPSSAT